MLEGGCYIDCLNSKSSYLLSLGLNYLNTSNKILSDKDAPRSHIFIHDRCVTVGCLPMTDDKIKEIYVLTEFSKYSGQNKIPVHVFPFHLTKENLQKLTTINKTYDMKHGSFWENLKGRYDYFEENKSTPTIKVNKQGGYLW